MVTADQEERADAEPPSVWAPMRSRVYRNLFVAQLASNIGSWMQSVAAQWFLVEKHSSDVIIALVQTASLGPTLLLGLVAGALADLFDRRRLLIVLQTYAVLVALALAILTYLGRVGPTALLLFTLAIGVASALTGSDWAAAGRVSASRITPAQMRPEQMRPGQRHASCTRTRICDQNAAAAVRAIPTCLSVR